MISRRIKNKKILIFLLLIVLLGTFLRTYNFKEWLLVRADQVRDADMAKRVLDEGIGKLSLLGPKITKVQLPGEDHPQTAHLGPYYYYSQAFFVNFFNNPDPWILAIPELILAILAIPLFYLILSKFFNQKTSLLVTLFFSCSFLLIQYSRFAWNPNQLAFWNLLFIYALLNFSESNKKSPWWFLISFVVLMVVSQLHFLAMVVVSLVFVLFAIYKKFWQKIKLKHYLIGFGILVLFYLPMITSDIKNDGDNIKRVFASVMERKSEEGLAENLEQVVEKTSRFYLYFILPIDKDEIVDFDKLGFVYLSFSLLFLFLILKGKVKSFNDFSPGKKKDLIVLLLIYFAISSIINMGIANSLGKSRYWILVAPLTFMFFAFWVEFVVRKNKNLFWKIILILISVFILWENFHCIQYWYLSQQGGDGLEQHDKDPILRSHREFVTFGQIERISDYMAQKASELQTGVCYFSTDYQTKNVYKYIASYKYKTLFKTLDKGDESSKDCLMFLISKKDERLENIKEDLTDRFVYKKIHQDGALVLWEVRIKNGLDRPARGSEIFIDEKDKEYKAVFWDEIF
jgi:hypothetical protein